MQTMTLRCDDSVASHIYALLSNTRGVEIEKQKKPVAKKQVNHAFLEYAGLWKNRDITLSSIRDLAWKR
jgi:hypothetical protein